MKFISIIAVSSILLCASTIVSAEDTATPKKILRVPIKRSNHQPAINNNNSSRRLRKRDTSGSNTPLLNANGKEYLIEVGVGTPPQYFNLTLDTGSADFWVPSTSCPVTMCPHTRFNNQKSTTFKPLPQQLSIEYGIGSAKGVYGIDAVTVGTATMTNQTIGLVSNTNNILSANDNSDPSNGIFGIGYPNLSMKTGEKPGHFVMGLYQSQVISEPVFSIFLNSQFAYGKSGEIVLGGTDPTQYSGDIQYAPVVSYDASKYYVSPNIGANQAKSAAYLYWSVPGQGVSTSTGYKMSNTSLQAYILDTGTTLTYVPASIAKEIVMSITVNAKTTQLDAINGVYRVSCGLAKKTDSVQFMISQSTSTESTTPIIVNVPVSELVIPLDDAKTPETSKSCMFGIAPAPVGLDLTSGDTWILGEATLRSLYTVYDLKQNRVGIAKLATGAGTISGTNTTSTTPSSNTSSGAGNGTGGAKNPNSSSSSSSSSAADKSASSSSSLGPSSSVMSAVLSIAMLYYL